MGIQWIAEGSKSAKLVDLITKAVGPNGMVGGQYLDIDSTNNASVAGDAKFINKMEWLKTGCLIQASVEMAAVYAGASDIEQVKLVDFAKILVVHTKSMTTWLMSLKLVQKLVRQPTKIKLKVKTIL